MTGNQGDLFSGPVAARSDDTSQAAAQALEGEAVRLRRVVYLAIRAASPVDKEAGTGGLTADEVSEKVSIGILTGRPRCSELRKDGLIRDSGLRRPSSTGRATMIVWEDTPDE